MLNVNVLFLQENPKQDYKGVIYAILKNGSNKKKNLLALFLSWNHLAIK